MIAGIPVEEGTGSVYADVGLTDSGPMEIKAQLVNEIAEIIKKRGLTQERAAEILALTEPKVSRLLKGQFRGTSERRLPDCLTRWGETLRL